MPKKPILVKLKFSQLQGMVEATKKLCNEYKATSVNYDFYTELDKNLKSTVVRIIVETPEKRE